jgi:putative oxidoreductase
MNDVATRPQSASEPFVVSLVRTVIAWLERIPYCLLALIARVAPAAVFWRSGQTKVNGFALADSTIPLFQYEYKLPLIDPTIAAYASAIAEHVFPVLLVIGLASRFAAFALFVMTMVIKVFVFPDAWPTHGTWIACFLLIMARGPGMLSLDHLIARHYGLAKGC